MLGCKRFNYTTQMPVLCLCLTLPEIIPEQASHGQEQGTGLHKQAKVHKLYSPEYLVTAGKGKNP